MPLLLGFRRKTRKLLLGRHYSYCSSTTHHTPLGVLRNTHTVTLYAIILAVVPLLDSRGNHATSDIVNHRKIRCHHPTYRGGITGSFSFDRMFRQHAGGNPQQPTAEKLEETVCMMRVFYMECKYKCKYNNTHRPPSHPPHPITHALHSTHRVPPGKMPHFLHKSSQARRFRQQQHTSTA